MQNASSHAKIAVVSSVRVAQVRRSSNFDLHGAEERLDDALVTTQVHRPHYRRPCTHRELRNLLESIVRLTRVGRVKGMILPHQRSCLWRPAWLTWHRVVACLGEEGGECWQ